MSLPSTMPNSHDSERPTWVRWRIVALLVAYSFMTWFNRSSMSVAYVESIHDESGISPEAMGWVYSTFLATYMVFMTPGGWFIDRFGAWKALMWMGLGSALFGALTGLAGTGTFVGAGLLFPALLVIRGIMGIFTAPVYPAASRTVAHWIPPTQRARANGMVQAAAAIGIACSFPLFGKLIDGVGWQQAFVVSGVVTALLAAIWMIYARDVPRLHSSVNEAELRLVEGFRPVDEREDVSSIKTQTAPSEAAMELPGAQIRVARPESSKGVLRSTSVEDSGHETQTVTSLLALAQHKSLILLTICYAAVGYIEYLFYFWMQFYFQDVLNLSADQSRLYAAIPTLGLAVGMFAGGWAADRMRAEFGGWMGRALVPMVAMLASPVFLVLGVLAEEPWAIVAWLTLALTAIGAAESPVWTLAIELGGRYGATAAAVCNTGGNLGGLIAPILTPLVSGMVSRHFGLSVQAGWQWGISLGGLIGVLGALLWFWITPEETYETHA